MLYNRLAALPTLSLFWVIKRPTTLYWCLFGLHSLKLRLSQLPSMNWHMTDVHYRLFVSPDFLTHTTASTYFLSVSLWFCIPLSWFPCYQYIYNWTCSVEHPPRHFYALGLKCSHTHQPPMLGLAFVPWYLVRASFSCHRWEVLPPEKYCFRSVQTPCVVSLSHVAIDGPYSPDSKHNSIESRIRSIATWKRGF